jgi:response regulator RpfG family c-di-GMP phosphodiesterase
VLEAASFQAQISETSWLDSCNGTLSVLPAKECKSKEIVATDFAGVRILIVDDELSVRKMLAAMLAQGGIQCSHVASPKEALDKLQGEVFDAVISDLRMGPTSGMDLLDEVHRRYPDIAFLMATGVSDVRVGVQAMKKGAEDYFLKPFDIDVVLTSLDRALKKKQLEREVQDYRLHLESMVAERTHQLDVAMSQLEQSYSATLEALGSAIDLRDGATAGHSSRVLWYSIKLAGAVGGLEDHLKNLAMGAWLHDIGKLAIPDGILLKPGALNDEERTVMQRHVLIGYDLIKGIPFLTEASELILAHHERWDGSGYPRGLRGAEIPMSAKIFGVADTLDAITSDRPYRAARPFSAAREVIERGSGTLFDPVVAEAFLSIPEETWESIRTEAATKLINSVIAQNHLSYALSSDFYRPKELQLSLPRQQNAYESREALWQLKPTT